MSNFEIRGIATQQFINRKNIKQFGNMEMFSFPFSTNTDTLEIKWSDLIPQVKTNLSKKYSWDEEYVYLISIQLWRESITIKDKVESKEWYPINIQY